jgi:hypothetical protein
MTKRSMLVWAFLCLAMAPAANVRGDCPSSWYKSSDDPGNSTCALPNAVAFYKTVHWQVQWYCDPAGYRDVKAEDSGACVCGSVGPCFPVFDTPFIDTTGMDTGIVGAWCQKTYSSTCVSGACANSRIAIRNVLSPPSCCSSTVASGGDPCANFDYSTCDYSGGNGLVGNVGPSPGCCGPSPILIDLSGAGFHLTDAEDGVNFDLDSDGIAERIGWASPGSSLGFLCLDRNGNGIIDNGKELFGNHTPQPPSPHPNGFLALAVYDQRANGGNGDGIIDSRDAIFPYLRIWVDSNHNGISEPGELHTLTDAGITAISLDYSYSFRRDQFGNQFRYWARVFDARGAHDGPIAYDVYFVRAADH